MIGRFLTRETLVLLAAGEAVVAGLGYVLGFGVILTLCLGVAFALFGFMPIAARMQDWLLERALAAGRYEQALRLAAVIRDSAKAGVSRDLAEFDVGLVHLARGAPADATRSFQRIEAHRLKGHTKVLVALYRELAKLRAEPAREPADRLVEAAEAALVEFKDDPTLLAAKAEAHLARDEFDEARQLLTRSLDLNPDALDPSPGERYVLFARAALGTGGRDLAVKSLRVAAALRADGPFVRAARAELAQLVSDAA